MSDEGGGFLRPHHAPAHLGIARGARSRIGRALRPALLLVLIAGALTSAVAVPRTAAPRGGAGGANLPPTVVRGHVRGLYPGVTKPMRVLVRNPASFAVRVTRVTVRVSTPSRACRARNVWIARFAGSRRIPAHARIRISLSSGMRSTAPNACQGARFPVTFTATLVKA